ncbi:type II toxin-antitoxin system VapC family toxin [Aquisalimonas sp.]|uniref:type II toxin-antitoxin system VapC family toxin n=1 Tax=Aquisalimonas sp. TaxID=1872621 RepID=UPI0025C39B93|nr:type II toxin-antitoxin system VapC family toxin [Aquisalimonas sp.]
MTDAPTYILDTNILSALIRHPRGVVRDHIARVGETAVGTSIIVASELRFGAEKRASPALSAQIEAILNAMVIVPQEPPADVAYARIRHQLERDGTPIGPNDLLIAAQVSTMGATLVTANVGEFERVPALRVANWL